MTFESISGIESVLKRIQEIQARINPTAPSDISQIKPETSFDSILNKAIEAQNFNPYGNTPLPGYFNSIGVPFGGYSPIAAWINSVAITEPTRMIEYQGFKMQAQTASNFLKLENMIHQVFPGRQITITSTTEGKHLDPDHPAGKAIDFVVSGLTRDESRILEDLCVKSGFKPFNEYIYSSPYKTGDHMHINLAS